MYRLLLLVLLTEQVGYLSAPAWRYLLADDAHKSETKYRDGEKASYPDAGLAGEIAALTDGVRAEICPILRVEAQRIYDNGVSVIPNDGVDVKKRPVIVIGDPHGSYDELLAIMQANGMVDAADDFIGKQHIVVIMGDLIHRGPNSQKCVEMVLRWQRQAPSYGSNIIVLLGNHEWEQFWFGYGNIANDGYESASFAISDELQREYLQDETNLRLIKENFVFVAKIGNNLFTHSGFNEAYFAEAFGDLPEKHPQPSGLIDAINFRTKEALKDVSNDELDRIHDKFVKDYVERRDKYEDEQSQNDFKYNALVETLDVFYDEVERLQPEGAKEIDGRIPDIFLVSNIGDMLRSQLIASIPSQEQVLPVISTYADFLLELFVADNLWVGHFYGQMSMAKSIHIERDSERVMHLPKKRSMIFTDEGMSQEHMIAYVKTRYLKEKD